MAPISTKAYKKAFGFLKPSKPAANPVAGPPRTLSQLDAQVTILTEQVARLTQTVEDLQKAIEVAGSSSTEEPDDPLVQSSGESVVVGIPKSARSIYEEARSPDAEESSDSITLETL